MILLDSTFLIDVLRGRPETEKILNSSETLLTTQINMYEIITGIFLQKQTANQFSRVKDFFDQIVVLSLDDDAVLKAGELNATLIKKGEIIGDCDCLIAGIALSKNISTIITKNKKHFEKIEGINVISY